jgi:CheY-like chemotaxis protein/anti-sigma regulatory factor (Ser/Thr protein kinase)
MELAPICINLVREFSKTAKDKSLDLSFQNNYGDAKIFADEYSIILAVSNLIDNAIKYTNNGFIQVILYKEKNDDIILDINDTGIGIGEKYLDKIFEPYLQEQMGYGRAFEGVGLGLALVKKILYLNDAVISIKSKKEKGTTFSINFGKGVKAVEKKPETVYNSHSSSDPGNWVVLIVEDDALNQVTIKRFIENKYNTLLTDSSDEALEILKKNKVDIILMDISIKGKKNGLEFTKDLKASKEFSHIPVVAITAHAFEEDRQNALGSGCDNFLAKPFTKKSLLTMIAEIEDKSKFRN